MSEFLDSLIDRKIVTDATSIEDLQIEAGGSGSSSSLSLKTFIDSVKGGAELTDDTPVGVKVTLDTKDISNNKEYVVCDSTNNAGGTYNSDCYYLIYDVSEKSFGTLACINSGVNDLYYSHSLPPKDFILFVAKPRETDGSFILNTSISATQNIFYNTESTFVVAEGTVPELVYYKDLVNY